MKKHIYIILTSILITCSLTSCWLLFGSTSNVSTRSAIGQNRFNVATKAAVGGLWGDSWNNKDYKILTSISNQNFELTLYPRDDEPWNYVCKIKVKDFKIPTKKTEKEQRKSKKWYSYDCEVEFFYDVELPSIEDCFANYGGFVISSADEGAKKRVVSATLKLNPDFFIAGSKPSNYTMTINLVLDNVGFAISFMEYLLFELK